jgi:hypothetical protein
LAVVEAEGQNQTPTKKLIWTSRVRITQDEVLGHIKNKQESVPEQQSAVFTI